MGLTARSIKLALFAGFVLGQGTPAYAQSVPAQNFQQSMVNWTDTLRKLLSGVRVTGATNEGTSQQRAQMLKASKQGVASARISHELNMAIMSARQKYSYEAGQGYNVCREIAGQNGNLLTSKQSQSTSQALTDADNKRLSENFDGAAYVGQTLANRRQYYCSEQELTMGLCSVRGGGRPAGDSDAGVFLRTRSYGTEEVMTGADFIDVVAPFPSQIISPYSTPQQLEAISARRKAALMSGARQSIFGVVVGGMEGSAENAQ